MAAILAHKLASLSATSPVPASFLSVPTTGNTHPPNQTTSSSYSKESHEHSSSAQAGTRRPPLASFKPSGNYRIIADRPSSHSATSVSGSRTSASSDPVQTPPADAGGQWQTQPSDLLSKRGKELSPLTPASPAQQPGHKSSHPISASYPRRGLTSSSANPSWNQLEEFWD